MQLYHASRELVDCPEIIRTRYTKDFSWGFYCTENYSQAERWARRNKGVGDVPTINIFQYIPSDTLKVLKFEEMNDEWLDFIAACRAGTLHDYDIIEGPMADDEVWNFVEDFILGDLSREAFWVMAKFRHPTHQISFHTVKALGCLTFKEAKEVQNENH